MALKFLGIVRVTQHLQSTPQHSCHWLLYNSSRLFSHQPSSASPTYCPLQPDHNSNFIDKKSTLKDVELAKFSAVADTWWDSEGPFKPLHSLNPTRLAFIRSTLCWHFRKDPQMARPFKGLKIADVRCGGGILSEPLARMGATVTGVDAVEKNIKIARLHADLDPVTSAIEYCCTTAEKLVEEERKFDAVIALEVVEHVANPDEFCKSVCTNLPRWSSCNVHNQPLHESICNSHCCCRVHSSLDS